MIKPIFTGQIKKGKLILDELDNFELWISQWEDKKVDVIVEKYKSTRTLKQNAYLWSCIYKLIGDEIGYTAEEVHQLCKSMFLKKHLDVKEKRYTIVGSTASLNTVDFTHYIEAVKDWASQELGIFIPEAENVELK